MIYNIAINSWKFFIPRIEADIRFWKSLLKESFPFGVTGITGMIYNYVDAVLLSLLLGNAVVGIYSASYRLMVILLFIPSVMNMAIFPAMSRFHITSKSNLKLIQEKYLKIMIIIGIPIGISITILASDIILLIYGPIYFESIKPLQILIWSTVLIFITAPFIILFESINKQVIITKITIICVIINIVLNLIFIPKYSYIAASLITVLTELIILFSITKIVYNIGYGLESRKIIKITLKTLFASMIMALFLNTLIILI